MPVADFWYEFASTYSYPAAMRVEALAASRGVRLRWRPFLLGPIFASRGMMDSPFNLDAAKGRYMWSDLKRICARLGLPLARPEPFPQNSCSPRAPRWRSMRRGGPNSPAPSMPPNLAAARRSPKPRRSPASSTRWALTPARSWRARRALPSRTRCERETALAETPWDLRRPESCRRRRRILLGQRPT